MLRSNPTGMPFGRIFGRDPQISISTVPRNASIWQFSEKEISDLTIATVAFTAALGFMFSNGIIGALNNPNQFILGAIRSLLALAPAFVLHEIAHKFMAKRYGCWAEFRADPSGLRFGLILSALTGIVFMAPGAVMVLGRTTTAQFGRIALAGPVTNIALWLIGAILIVSGHITGIRTDLTDILLLTWVPVGKRCRSHVRFLPPLLLEYFFNLFHGVRLSGALVFEKSLMIVGHPNPVNGVRGEACRVSDHCCKSPR